MEKIYGAGADFFYALIGCTLDKAMSNTPSVSFAFAFPEITSSDT